MDDGHIEVEDSAGGLRVLASFTQSEADHVASMTTARDG